MNRKITKKDLIGKIPFFIFCFAIAWITYSLHRRAPDKNLIDAICLGSWTFSFYIKQFFAPIKVLPLYMISFPVGIENTEYVSSIVFTGIIVFALAFFRKNKIVMFAFLFYVLSSFFLYRFDLYDVSFVADRFLYLPSLGFCIALGVAGESALKKNRNVSMLLMFALFTLLGAKNICAD